MIGVIWIYLFIFALSSFTSLYLYFLHKYTYWKKRNVFHFEPAFPFGNILPILTLKRTLGQWLADLSLQTKKDYFGIYIYTEPILVINSPKLIKSIMQKDFNYFQDRSVASYKNDPVMSNVMFFSTNPKWKAMRNKMSPAFTSGKLKMMFPLMVLEADAMMRYIDKLVNVPNVETKEICAKYSTNVIAKCAFAVDAQSFENPNAEFRNIGRRLFDFRYSTALRQFAAWVTPNLMTMLNINFFDAQDIEKMKNIFTDVLHSRMTNSSSGPKDLINILIEIKKNETNSDFTENVLVAQAIQFYLAGFETVSSTFSFALYELCIHPNIQETLRQEIIENLGKNQGITYEGILEMKFLDMCVSEVLRKYPVLPFIDRKCIADYRLDGSDLIVEKGTSVYIPMFGLHYDPNLFPEPEKFDPERFIDKTKINNDGLYYIPFGDGPRICIGNRFGLMAVKIGIVAVLSKFKLEVTDKTPVPIKFETKSILLQSTVGIPLKFVPL